jgi:hypothetical protein
LTLLILFNYTQIEGDKMNNLPKMTVEMYITKAVEIVTKALSDAGINNEIIRTCAIDQESENTWSVNFMVRVPLGELFIDPESAR